MSAPSASRTFTAEAPPIDGSSTAARHVERILFVAALAAAVVFIAAGIQRPVWLDEAYSALTAGSGFAGIVDSLSRDNNFPAYYFLLSIWMRLFGDSEISLRILSGLFYVGGCAAVFALGRRVAGTRAGWYSALLYECSTLAIRHAQNIRTYELLGMLSGLSTLALIRIFRHKDSSPAAVALLLAANALGILSHVWFVFVLLAQLAMLLALERRQALRFLGACAISALPFAVLWGPQFVGQLHNGATDWMPSFELPRLVLFLVLSPLEFYGPLVGLVLFVLTGATALVAHTRQWKWRFPTDGLPLFLILVVSIAGPLAISIVRPIYFPGRYTILALAPLAVLLGTVLSALLPRAVLAVGGILLLAVQVTGHLEGTALAADGRASANQSDRVTAEFLLAHAAPRDAVVFTSLTRAAADYYFGRARAAAPFVEFSFPAAVATHLGWEDVRVPPARAPLLETESAALAERLGTLAEAGATVWMYDGYAPDETAILRAAFSKTLMLEREYPMEGPYHTRILKWRLKQPAKAATP